MWPEASPADGSAADALTGIDLDRAVVLAADARPWGKRAHWHLHAPCVGDDTDAYFGCDSLDATQLRCCRSCPVRTECAVDGIRQNLDGTVAESPAELWGSHGGLTAEQRWELVGAVRRRAAEMGVRLHDDAAVVGERVAEYVADGRSVEWIAAELYRGVDFVVDVIVVELAARGWSNRCIAEVLDGPSYKWVERRRRALGCPAGPRYVHRVAA